MSKAGGVTYIVILNWNGWADTLECMQSVFNLTNECDYHVVICDNGSEDDSVKNIRQWLEGRLCATGHLDTEEYHHRESNFTPPISYREISIAHSEAIRDPGNSDQCTIISIGKNLGFAGGCNIGIRYSLSQTDCNYVWLLNNDTVVTGNSLQNLVREIDSSNRFGACGSTLIYYDMPDRIQAQGGAIYFPCIGLSRHISAHRKFNVNNLDPVNMEKMSYIVGASLLVKAEVFREVGLLNEEYFLYCEELDFSERLRGKYQLAYAEKSIVYHKEGATTGGSSIRKNKSDLSLFYSVRSKLLFTRKYYRYCLPTVYLMAVFRMIYFLFRLDFKHSVLVLKVILGHKYDQKNNV